MSICLIDTSIFVEILNVPNLAASHAQILGSLKKKIAAKESLFLPLATILETGNHIAQNGSGAIKRKIAGAFIDQVRLALQGHSPFSPVSCQSFARMQDWLAEFPDFAMRKESFGDLSIIQDWQKICAINRTHRVYIWSLDRHLAAYDRSPGQCRH